MVCKEEVLLWFKDLDSYKRIDVMYELISMCVPFEVRIVGSFIEEVGKTSFQELRGPALNANDLDKLTKDATLTQGLIEEGVRHRVIIYLSLLSGSNWKCANWFYKTLLRTEWVESCVLRQDIKDDNLLSELLLLFTIGMRHPAFSFEQKMFFGDLLEQLLKQKDSIKCALRNKPFSGCSPSPRCNSLNIPKGQSETHTSPVKPTSYTELDGQLQQLQGFANILNGPVEMHQTTWNRPGFAGTISGAPEIAPFPPPPVSPLMSQPSSPTRSRATSPHKPYGGRILQPSPLVDFVPGISLDPLASSNVPLYSEAKSKDDELNHIADDKLRDTPWFISTKERKDIKPPNGIRLSQYTKVPSQQKYILEQIQALNLDGANSLHCSNSGSSSDNSSPPDTPSTTPAVPHHGPGRGENKSRINGVPQFVNSVPAICDTTTPPPPLNNCSVPYTNYPPPVALPAVAPNRSVYPYTQTYRMPFNSHFNYQHPEIYSFNNCSYMPYIFSSTPSQIPPRITHCFNCGATGHNGSDCNGQTIEDITQKKAYTLDYNSTLPDADK